MMHPYQRISLAIVACWIFLFTACTNDAATGYPTDQPTAAATTPPPTATATPTITPTIRPSHTPRLTPTLPAEIEPLVGAGWGIYLITPDGENMQRLTEIGKDYRYPAFSPDGTQIAFVETVTYGPDSLMLYSFETEEVESLFPADGDIEDFSWSPDSSQIAVLIQSGENAASLAVFDLADGTLEELLTWEGSLSSVSWSYDGLYIAFTGSEPITDATPSLCDKPKTEVYMLNLSDNQLTRLTSTGGVAFEPMWSPTEYVVVYVVKTEEGICIVSVQLLYPFEVDSVSIELFRSVYILPLIWSPDGQYIAEGGATGSGTYKIDDQSRGGLTFGAASYFPTGWSPDNRYVVIESSGCCIRHMLLVDTKVASEAENIAEAWSYPVDSKIASNQFWSIEAQWSPIEDLIVFSGLWDPPIP